jgi:alkaline phosphatase D
VFKRVGRRGGRRASLSQPGEQAIDNVVVLTGDLHMSWALDLNDDPNEPLAYDPATGDGSIAVEFVVSSVTSPGLPGGSPQFRDLFVSQNPHILWGDVETHGYVVLDVTPERAEAAERENCSSMPSDQ